MVLEIPAFCLQNVKKIEFLWGFNCNLSTPLPSLTHVKFSDSFITPINHLSSVGVPIFPSLTHLTFGKCFNQMVDNLPPTIIYLKFGEQFNLYVDKLPPALEYLEFGM